MEDTTNKIGILVVIENKMQGSFIESFFDPEKYTVSKILNGREAYDFLISNEDLSIVVIMSYQLPEMEGIEIMKAVKAYGKEYAYIFLTADKTVERAIEAMKSGAIDFVPKSGRLNEDLPPMVDKAFEVQNRKLEQEKIKKELDQKNKELIKLSIVARETTNAVSIYDSQCNLEWTNEGFSKLYSRIIQNPAEIVGKSIFEISKNVDIKQIVENSISQKATIPYTTEIAIEDEVSQWIQTALTPIVDENGDLFKLVIIDTDITEIKLAEHEIMKQKESITNSILYAERIQKALLSSSEVLRRHFSDYFILFKPRDIVSGDFFWFKESSDGKKLLIAAADCTGHGVPGAFMSMLGMSGLNQISQMLSYQETFSANDLLNSLRNFIITTLNQTGKSGEAADGMDLALCLFDIENKHLQYAGANNPLYQIRNGELTVFNANKMPIGIHKNAEIPFANNEIEILPNDLYYIFSDGYIDQFGGETGLKFFSRNFKDLLVSINDKPMDVQRDILEKTHNEFRGKGKQTDDMLVIGIRF